MRGTTAGSEPMSEAGEARVEAPALAASREIELKLRLAPGQADRLLQHRLVKAVNGARPPLKRLVSTYFDTSDGGLLKQRVVLRVRRDGRRRIQAVKSELGLDESILARREVEAVVKGDQPVLALITDPALKPLFDDRRVKGCLKPLFVTDIRRRLLPLKLRGTTVELALDVGRIRSGRGEEAVCEAEIELKSGSIDGLYRLARELHKTIPFTIETRTKAERGYQLALDTPPRATRATSLKLPLRATVGEALVQIGRNCLRQIRANQTVLVVSGRSQPGGVHQLRVAIRRIRSALAAFKAVIPELEWRRLAHEFRWIAQQCGPAREWDVFAADILKPLQAQLGDEPALAELARLAAAAREAAYDRVEAMLADPRFTDYLLEIEAWWESDGTARPAMGRRLDPVRDFAKDALRHLHRRLIKQGRQIDALSLPELHELRIRAKKLRYNAEFFRSLFPAEAVQDYLSALERIQDRLGSLNDAAVARNLLGGLHAEAGTAEERAAIDRANAMVAGWNAARIESDRARLPEAWERFSRVKPFWR